MDKSNIKSGDYLAIARFDGLDPLSKLLSVFSDSCVLCSYVLINTSFDQSCSEREAGLDTQHWLCGKETSYTLLRAQVSIEMKHTISVQRQYQNCGNFLQLPILSEKFIGHLRMDLSGLLGIDGSNLRGRLATKLM